MHMHVRAAMHDGGPAACNVRADSDCADPLVFRKHACMCAVLLNQHRDMTVALRRLPGWKQRCAEWRCLATISL